MSSTQTTINNPRGWPRPFVTWTEHRQSFRVPLPWVAGDEVLEPEHVDDSRLAENVCQVCGEALADDQELYVVTSEHAEHDGEVLHRRCWMLTAKWCPHFQAANTLAGYGQGSRMTREQKRGGISCR